jgi:hypothetical protein
VHKLLQVPNGFLGVHILLGKSNLQLRDASARTWGRAPWRNKHSPPSESHLARRNSRASLSSSAIRRDSLVVTLRRVPPSISAPTFRRASG